ncbi:helix-turn-helix domain-containing protein [Nakamurella endophytica]|uniref:HTH cro/C1-type domain-containing protein n=1 Tax=Nakamurella endophytica TaxID=1748367 RepID=A0A917SYW3_9ACTN|nr:helix-turn-helix transcriptional regulator [Nakamurella endophytica]GGM04357.1 hypothetical protein GCM10011594_25720 [Nakamurella endophytica]
MDLTEVLTPVKDLGAFIREQRTEAQISLRALAARAGVSNPYLSQVERGLRRPSADILAQIARGLSISAESLLARAGVLDPPTPPPAADHTAGTGTVPGDTLPGGTVPVDTAPGDTAHRAVVAALRADPALSGRHRSALIDLYTALRQPGTAG